MPRPGMVRQPAADGRAKQLGLGGKVDDVGDPEIAAAARRRGTGMPGYFAMPTGVVLTRPSALPRPLRDVA